MRFSLPATVVSCALLASCAYQGVIVDKSARELPFGETYGMDGSLAFMLKDNSGVVRRQIVTPEVFARYQVGDYFDDLQSGPTRQPGSDGKTVLTASNSSTHATTQTVAHRKTDNTRALAHHKTSTAHRLAHYSSKSHHATAAAKRPRTKKIVPTVKAEQAPTIAAAAQQPTSTEIAFVRVAQVRRCR